MSVHDQFCSDIFKFCTDISDSVLPFHKLIAELQLHFKYYHLQTSRADSIFHRGPNMTVENHLCGASLCKGHKISFESTQARMCTLGW